MAKIGNDELVRLKNDAGDQVLFTGDGRRLGKYAGGTRWTVLGRYTGARRGEEREAWIAFRVVQLVATGKWTVNGPYSHRVGRFITQASVPNLGPLALTVDAEAPLASAKRHLEAAKVRKVQRDLERAKAWEAGREQREREAAEVAQFAEVAIAARLAASRAICCTLCGRVLDASNTILLADRVAKQAICGTPCWDALADHPIATDGEVKVEADGRTVPAHVWKHSTESLVGAALLAARQTA